MNKIYVAGAFKHKEKIQKIMNDLITLGFTITHNWTSYELTYTDQHERNKNCALKDVKGVVEADLLLVILDDDNYPYRGTSSEIGAALSKKILAGDDSIKIWIVANQSPNVDKNKLPYCMTSCFMHTADLYFTNISDVIDKLKL